MKRDVAKLKSKLSTKEDLVVELEMRLEYVERKLKVYDAFFKDSGGPRPSMDEVSGEAKERQDNKLSDLGRTVRLERLSIAESGAESKNY